MRARFPSLLAVAILGAVLLTPRPVAAQVNVYADPGWYSHWDVGTPVNVTVEFCAMSGTLAWQQYAIYVNGEEVTWTWSYVAGSGPQCQSSFGVDGFSLSGSITIANGPNDVRAVCVTDEGNCDETITYFANYAAKVTPDAGTASHNANTTGLSKVFTVVNPGYNSNTYSIACAATGQVTCTGTSVPSVNLAGWGGSSNVTAYYNVGAGGSGTLKLTATGTGGYADSGWYNVTVLGPNVTPDAEPSIVPIPPGSGSFTQAFTITNPDPSSAHTYTLSASCAVGIFLSCTVPSPITLTANQAKLVNVAYTFWSNVPGDVGYIVLTATNQAQPSQADTGSVLITIGPSGVALDRGQCLTIAAGASAAYECGDLRITHALPGVRSLNKDRAPVLIYNTQHARPYPLLQTNITAPNPLPDSIRAIARIGGVVFAQRSWPASAWGSAGQVRRVVVGFLADTATGIYNYELEIQRLTIGSGPVTLYRRPVSYQS